jgi:prepilin-type N-terminal cleavage/methylation domain-containing protein/prepilin-type processing-associated H-X9-DG protein
MVTRRRRAFTLVELLVVVGIVVVLIAILLPVLGRARAQADRVRCASNLRQLAHGVIAYVHDNKCRYPTAAHNSGPLPTDWAHWQPDRDLADSAIARYLSGLDPDLLRCPGDDPDVRGAEMIWSWVVPYRYSYSYNELFEQFRGGGRRVVLHLRHASDKILFIDEDEATADDGAADLGGMILGGPDGSMRWRESLLASRHDPGRYRGPLADVLRRSRADRPDKGDRGNAAFADGHVDYVTRWYTWQRKNYHPWGPVVPLNFPGPR